MATMDVRHFAIDATEEAIYSFTVAIVVDGENGACAGVIGTGVAIEWRKRLMFVTARHVIYGTPLERTIDSRII